MRVRATGLLGEQNALHGKRRDVEYTGDENERNMLRQYTRRRARMQSGRARIALRRRPEQERLCVFGGSCGAVLYGLLGADEAGVRNGRELSRREAAHRHARDHICDRGNAGASQKTRALAAYGHQDSRPS